MGGNGSDGFEIDIADGFSFAGGGIGDSVDADVDYDGAGSDVFGGDKSGLAGGGDEDVCVLGEIGEILRKFIATEDGGFALHEEHGKWFSDDIAGADAGDGASA